MSLGHETVYGIVSDSHRNPYNATLAMSTLVGLGAQALILNGDLSEDTHFRKKFEIDTQNSCFTKGEVNVEFQERISRRNRNGYYFDAAREWTSTILDMAVALGVPTYVQPGSHERKQGFGDVLEHYTQKYPNIIDTCKERKIFEAFHQVVFLPGSDVRGGGEYGFHTGFRASGLYQKLHGDKSFLQGDSLDESWREVSDMLRHRHLVSSGVMEQVDYIQLDSLIGLINDPKNTIIFSHVPPRFSNRETGVDMNYFAEHKDGGLVEGIRLEQYILNQFQIEDREQIYQKAKELGFVFKIENRGNKELGDLLETLGVRRVVSGHFHESGGRAHDFQEKKIIEGISVKELFWNVGQVDQGRCGLLYVGQEDVAYRNVDFTQYARNLGHDRFGYVAVDYSYEKNDDDPNIEKTEKKDLKKDKKKRVQHKRKKSSNTAVKKARKKARRKK